MPPELAGKKLSAVAAETGTTPIEAALDIIRRVEIAPITSFSMNGVDI